jgi:hypothetical protein
MSQLADKMLFHTNALVAHELWKYKLLESDYQNIWYQKSDYQNTSEVRRY